MLEELEAESKHWVNTQEDITAKITDDLWKAPGNNSAGGQITMPDEHLWRFSADVGLYDQEEEVCMVCVCAHVNFVREQNRGRCFCAFLRKKSEKIRGHNTQTYACIGCFFVITFLTSVGVQHFRRERMLHH